MNKPLESRPAEQSGLPDLAARPSFFGTGRIFPPAGKTEEEREAAWQRFLEGTRAGYTSDGTKITRDEMNERW